MKDLVKIKENMDVTSILMGLDLIEINFNIFIYNELSNFYIEF